MASIKKSTSTRVSSIAISDTRRIHLSFWWNDKIYRAPIGRPVDWEDTGATLPTTLYGSQFARIIDRIYLFGGNDGSQAVKTIFSAPLSDPLTWTNHGDLLPEPLYFSQLVITGGDGYLFLLGGHGINNPTDKVFYASIDDPLVWSTHSVALPIPLFGSSVYMNESMIYLLIF